MLVAMAVVLNFFRANLFANGGSLELTMIPLAVFALRRGWGWGVGAGFVFGTLKCIIGGGIAYGWASLLLDYSVAFAVVGLAGLLPAKPVVGSVIGAAARYAMHVIAGAVIWGEYMPEEFLGLGMSSAWIYSLLYNATYMIPNAILLCAFILIFAKTTNVLKTDA